MEVISAKLVIFLAFILCIAIFAGFFIFIFIRKNERPGDRKAKKKKKKKLNAEDKDEDEDEYINYNPEKFSEVESRSRKQRQSRKEKYPNTQTLTNLLDIEDDEASEDFTTSLLSERELNENPHFSEIVFESASLAGAGEAFGTEAEIDHINSLDERTQLLEDMEFGIEEEYGTALLFDEDDVEFSAGDAESSSIVEKDEAPAEVTAPDNNSSIVEAKEKPAPEPAEELKDNSQINSECDSAAEEKEREARCPTAEAPEYNPAPENSSIVEEKEQDKENPPAEELVDAPIKSQGDPENSSEVEPEDNSKQSELEGGSIIEGNLFIGKLLENTEFNDLDNPVFLNCELRSCSFSEKALINAKFIGAKLISCSFLGTEMPDSSFDNVLISDCSFKFASLSGVSIINSVFQGCNLEKADFDESIIEKTQFTECRFDKKTSFNNAILKEADFDSKDGPDLSKVGHII